jgi:hypothetical protein
MADEDSRSIIDRYTGWFFAILCLGLFVYISYGVYQTFTLNGAEYFWGGLTVGEAAVGFGTLFLAAFTAVLASDTVKASNKALRDSQRSRGLMLQENQRERRRSRIKEQLEGLYSPLMSIVKYFEDPREHFTPGTIPWREMDGDIRFRYEFLASNSLREKFREYYVKRDEDPLVFRGGSRIPLWETRGGKGEGTPEFSTLLSDWETRLKELSELIKKDFEELVSEYNTLTSPPE